MLATYVNSGKDYFDEMADVFYQAQTDLFGEITDIYAVDPFHEGGRTGDMNVSKVYEIIQKKMMEHDKDAIWLIQQWQGSMSDAKLQGLKEKDHAMVLDLFSEINSQSDVMERNQIPWVWNMLHNFGGRMGLDANPAKLAQEIPKAYAEKSYMTGIGMTPEALENSPMAYELLWDMTWTKDAIDYRDWVQKYAERNYGGTNQDIEEVWNILLDTGYNQKNSYYQGAAESVMNARPTMNFTSASTWGHSTINYDKKELERAAYLMAKNYDTFKDSPAFLYDLSDITRQVLANAAQDYHKAMVNAYNAKDEKQFSAVADKFLEMILLQDQVLSTNQDFLVGNWLEDARSMLADADDWTKDLFEFNARSLITTWGGKKNANGGGLKDYSNRQWAGLTKDYYYPRWERWVNDIKANLASGTNMPNRDWFMMEWAWVNKKSDEGSTYTTTASDLDISQLTLQACENYSLDVLETIVGEVEEKENIALGKNVSASVTSDHQNPLSNLTDGNKNTPWKAEKNEGTFTLTVDLENVSSIEGMEISLPQLAGGFPYAYEVEVFQDGSWTSIAKQEEQLMTSQTLIDYRGIASQVRFTLSTSDTSIIPEVTELIVYGKAEKKAVYENLALSATASSDRNSQGGRAPSNAIDGDLGSIWVNDGGHFPTNFYIDLSKEEHVDLIELYFEKKDLPFKYKVVVEDAKGVKTTVLDMSNNAVDLERMYKISVNANVKKVSIEFIGRATGGSIPGAWAALAEVKILKEQEVSFKSENIAAGKPGLVSNEKKQYNTDKLTNGDLSDLENIQTDIFPTTFTTDLQADQEISEVRVYFEKAGIRFQFKVDIEDASGKRTTILDKLDNVADLDAMYTIPANIVGSKIHVVIEGRAQGGNFYLASPALSEIEAYTKPESMSETATITSNVDLSADEKAKLVDGNYDTFVNFNQQGETELIFAFEKPVDIYAYELYKDATSALQYKVEYANDAKVDTWEMLDDESNNLSISKKHVTQFDPVLTSRIRLTLLNACELHDFNLYHKEANAALEAYIHTLNDALAKVTIGEYAGNYPQAAKDALDQKVDVAKQALTNALNSAEANAHIQALKDAYAAFLKTYITIDRTGLLVELCEVKALLAIDELADDATLTSAYDKAKVVYDTTKVSQQQLDEAALTLQQAKEVAIAKLDSIGRYHATLAIAQSLVEETSVGNQVGQVSQATMDALEKAIQVATSGYHQSKPTSEIDAITSALETAITTFKDGMVTYNKDALVEAIAQASTLQEKDYTKDSWKAITSALQQALKINETSTSMLEIEAATDALLAAMEQLVTLDRSQLLALLDQVAALDESLYSKDSYAQLVELSQIANALYNQISVNQEDLDQMCKDVQDKVDQLVLLNRQSLLDTIANVRKLHGEDYTENSWKQLLAALKKAQDIAIQVSINQVELDDANAALQQAIDALVDADYAPSKDALANLLEQAKAYLDGSDYTLASYTAFELAYQQALAVFADEQASVSQLQDAFANLENAIRNLEVKPGVSLPNISPEGQGDQSSTGSGTNTGDATNVARDVVVLGFALVLMYALGRKRFTKAK
ncbi:hypothetical protein A4S06_02505 [Erysipelotrichaceae bacterium MTC7]|nr:hypothetical protein A4S06_02505 [Erysipelotrichaceae bacterium MTC7]